jgi:hypothetical protein
MNWKGRERKLWVPRKGYNAVLFVEIQSTFRRNMSPPSTGSQNKPSKTPAWKQSGKHGLSFTLVSCLAYSSTLKTEATSCSETSVDFQRTTWCHIPEDITLHNHRCENLKSYISVSPLKYPAFAWSVGENQRQTSVRIGCLWIEILTRDLPILSGDFIHSLRYDVWCRWFDKIMMFGTRCHVVWWIGINVSEELMPSSSG